jgi:transposase
MISAISVRGEIHWMVYAEPMNSTLFTDYLGYLIDDVEGKIFLVADRAKYHTSHETALWLMDHKDRIELFFLPPYSPDLNPDEWVWENVKHDNIYRVVPTASRSSLRNREPGAPRALEKPRENQRFLCRSKSCLYPPGLRLITTHPPET